MMEKFYLGQIRDDKNILAVFIGRIDADSIGFYDNNGNLIAEWNPPEPLEASTEYRNRPSSFLTQLDSLWKDLETSHLRIDIHSKEVEDISECLGLDTKDVLGFTSLKMSQKLVAPNKKDDKSTFKSGESQNPNAILDNIDAKSEVKLNKLVDDRYTLADILGVSDPNATLICVHSCDIKDGRSSNSEFSFLIKYPDGRIEHAPMLSQDDGTSPDRDIYSANRDGSDIDKIAARSMYRIHSPLGDYMISTTYGNSGTLNLQLGKRDITEQDYMAVPLEDQTYTRYVTKEVQDLLDPERGIYQAHKSTEEISSHMGNDCVTSIAEADGDENTGHQHLEEEPDSDYYLTIASDILNKNPELEELYSLQGLAGDLQKYLNEHPDKTVEDFTEDRVASCDHYPSYDKH